MNHDDENNADTAIMIDEQYINATMQQCLIGKYYSYFYFKIWEQIVVEMEYGLRWIYRMHKKALADVKIVMAKTSHEKAL
jgi:hypothetical protein